MQHLAALFPLGMLIFLSFSPPLLFPTVLSLPLYDTTDIGIYYHLFSDPTNTLPLPLPLSTSSIHVVIPSCVCPCRPALSLGGMF